MSSLADIRAGLAANLATIPGVQVSAYVLANPTLPTIWVRPDNATAILYGQSMGGGSSDITMVVQAYVGAVSDINAQKQLDEFLADDGVSSVVSAIESDKTLGGACADLDTLECRAYQEYARPDGSTALGAEWAVLVITGS